MGRASHPILFFFKSVMFFLAFWVSIIILELAWQAQQKLTLVGIYIEIMIALNLQLNLDRIDIFIILSLPLCG